MPRTRVMMPDNMYGAHAALHARGIGLQRCGKREKFFTEFQQIFIAGITIAEELKHLRQLIRRPLGRGGRRGRIFQHRRFRADKCRNFHGGDSDDFLKRSNQRIHILLRIVHREGGTRRRADLEPIHHRLAAVMPGPHRDACRIQSCPQIQWRDDRIVHHERNDTRLVPGRADDAKSPNA